MKAFAVTTYGPDGLQLTDVPRPTLAVGDVRVEVRAAGINPLDTMVRDGEFKQLIPYDVPFVLGHDLAGIVTEVGSGVTGLAVGDEVYARPRDLRIGAFAEEIAVDAADVALKPTSLSFEEAAAVPLVALAAWQALVDLADVRTGQKVLVHAGAGGLGSTVIQLARHLGAYVATTAHARDLDTVRAHGADLVIDYTAQDFTEVVSGYDVVLDSLGPDSLEKSLTVLRPGGLAISVAGPPDPSFARQLGKPLLRPVMALLSRKVRRRAKKLGVRYSFFFTRADGARLAELAKLYDGGALRPVLDRTFGFDDTLEAMAYVEQGKAHGKVVVTR
jgi:NADPH:quinone reductase-like Zn-dependent oxidoreductase